jgi:acyl-coenzyme A synthetase/AMP-(fatty) acid ligase
VTPNTLPLLVHSSPDSVVAYRAGNPVGAGTLLADAKRLQMSLPGGKYALNICSDRYRFAVGLLACTMAGKTSLLSPSLVPEVVNYLHEFAPDSFCLWDEATADVGFPRLRVSESTTLLDTPAWQVPESPCEQEIAYVFTSGSTGAPVPHRKTWGNLACSARIEAGRLRLNDGRKYAVAATVPVQHMYGFESSLLLALQTGQAFCAERPFYPADVAGALSSIPRPRILVSTPLHLSAVLAAGIELPAVDLIVCATAPLDARAARDIETGFRAILMEIYGSTETGQIASRRTTASPEWQLWPEVRLATCDGRTSAHGGTVAEPTMLGDMIEAISDERFLLRGRTDDLVNIAGKRSSLAYLNHQLNGIPGVLDGVFFLREDRAPSATTGVRRLGAIAVAPGLAADAIVKELRRRVDPAFLPRPLRLVDRIPRDSTGKLQRSVLESLIDRARP